MALSRWLPLRTRRHIARIKSGDKILKIGDKSTLEMTVEDAVRLIRGEKDCDQINNVAKRC